MHSPVVEIVIILSRIFILIGNEMIDKLFKEDVISVILKIVDLRNMLFIKVVGNIEYISVVDIINRSVFVVFFIELENIVMKFLFDLCNSGNLDGFIIKNNIMLDIIFKMIRIREIFLLNIIFK